MSCNDQPEGWGGIPSWMWQNFRIPHCTSCPLFECSFESGESHTMSDPQWQKMSCSFFQKESHCITQAFDSQSWGLINKNWNFDFIVFSTFYALYIGDEFFSVLESANKIHSMENFFILRSSLSPFFNDDIIN